MNHDLNAAVESWLKLSLSQEETGKLVRMVGRIYPTMADAAIALLKETIPYTNYDPRPMAMIDHLSDQWPQVDVLSERAFHEALWPRNWRTDHLGAILRGVAYFDYYLVRIVERKLKNPHAVRIARRTFNEKVRFAIALDAIEPGLMNSLLIVAKIRNSFAHELGHQLQHSEVSELCSSLVGRPRELFACYTGGSSKSPQRFRHALAVLHLTLQELDAGRPAEYEWFDAALAERRLGGPIDPAT
jgi:hypothetical protein